VPSSAPSNHLALVPVLEADERAERAVSYAERLAPRVLAVHIRQRPLDRARGLEQTWARRLPRVPLMVLDGSTGDWEGSFLAALDALRWTEKADAITVVMADASSADAVSSLHLALRCRPGVTVRWLPLVLRPYS
jgi:hypothetical protein